MAVIPTFRVSDVDIAWCRADAEPRCRPHDLDGREVGGEVGAAKEGVGYWCNFLQGEDEYVWRAVWGFGRAHRKGGAAKFWTEGDLLAPAVEGYDVCY